jgi:hypothetical protein
MMVTKPDECGADEKFRDRCAELYPETKTDAVGDLKDPEMEITRRELLPDLNSDCEERSEARDKEQSDEKSEE